MKKLMVMAALAAAASCANAATILWQTGKMYFDGEGKTLNAGSTVVSAAMNPSAYLFEVDEDTYGKLASAAAIWAAVGEGSTLVSGDWENSTILDSEGSPVSSWSAANEISGGKISFDDDSDSYSKGDPLYGIVVVTLDTDNDGNIDYYSANRIYDESVSQSGENFTQAALFEGGTSGGTATTWIAVGGSEPVPEPTSGLLLLLGVAGLALRRKQK